MTNNWFEIDKNGLGKQAEELGKGRLIGELIQNALDEAGVFRIDVTLQPVSGRPIVEVTVEDDSPEGFRSLSDAYTLFAESYKRGNPEQRGQFNLGEKLVIACCESASISTTKGTIILDAAEGRVEKPRQKRERGSVFSGRIRMTREELVEAEKYLQTLLLPSNVVVTLNGAELPVRHPIREFEATLSTVAADSHGIMRVRDRKTKVTIFDVFDGETAHLYEMGLPIVETGDKWHVNIAQKIPLNRDRNNVTPAYLRSVRTLVLNNMHGDLFDEDGNQIWVRHASSDPNCSPEAIKKVLDLRFGKQRASFDPNDAESNKAWIAKGGTIVHGSMMNAQEWKNAKAAGAIESAGKLCPTPKPYSDDPDAPAADVIPEKDWTPGMKSTAEYTRFLAKRLLNSDIRVIFVDTENNFLACFAKQTGNKCQIHFNVRHLGKHWFERGPSVEVDELIIHEFGHFYSRDHLSEAYYDALSSLGARLKRLAMEETAEFLRFEREWLLEWIEVPAR